MEKVNAMGWDPPSGPRRVTVWAPSRQEPPADGESRAKPKTVFWENGTKLLIWMELDDDVVTHLQKNTKIK